jgi:hypothetical protein
MENVSTILMYGDTFHLFSIAVTAKVFTLLDNSDVCGINAELINESLVDYSIVKPSTN